MTHQLEYFRPGLRLFPLLVIAAAFLGICEGFAGQAASQSPEARAAEARAAQALEAALADSTVQAALKRVDGAKADTAALLARLGAIISPSGNEYERAAFVAERMRAIGLQNVNVDASPNAVGIIPGRSGQALVFISTLDDLATVAALQKVALRPPLIEGDRVLGPGTNTSATTAAMLAAAEALVKAGVKPEHDLVFAAVAQEETGLTGMRAAYAAYKDKAIGFVDILGDGRSISYGGLGIHWWKVVAQGPAGHSNGGGLPNVNQAISRAVDRIFSIPDPMEHKDERTILNIAMVQSGAVFNHKPETGWFSLDIRSLNNAVIEEIEDKVRGIMNQVAKETGIALSLEPVQLTPAGQIPGARDSRLVRCAEAVSRWLGLTPQLGNAGSSNMNLAVGNGTPAIGLGGSRGGNRGEPGEWADVPAMIRTAKHVVLLAATMGK